jgi:Fe-S oxidoreductase
LRDRYARHIRERFPKIPRRVSGYNLDELLPEAGFNVARALVGTEGTCVAVLEATLRLIDNPPGRALLVLGFEDVFTAGDHAAEVVSYGPIACEALDDQLIAYNEIKHEHLRQIQLLPPGRGWLLVEFNGRDREEAEAKAFRLMDDMRRKATAPSMKLFDDPEAEQKVWEVRESGLGATAWIPGHPASWPGWEDSAVAPEKVGNYMREFRKLLDSFGYECALYGHIGQGCVHCRISFDLVTAGGVRKYRDFISKAADLVVSYGGSLSGEHGDGQSRAEFLPKMFGNELVQAFKEFKAIWDPQGRMNPGKVVDPYPIDFELRLGPEFRAPEPPTRFHYPEDDGSFSHATMRCVGVGKCRRVKGGTMCPSFMVTLEEKHSTRGRARLLFEMLEGNPVAGGWRDEGVHDALHLCLSCKGCKGECPVNVDMATYKAEFLSHYYKGRLRPRAAYSMGLIFWWAQMASYAPGLANFLTQTPLLRNAAKLMGGIARSRSLPPFAKYTFKQWFQQRPVFNAGHPQVILWPDTFNNYFHPESAQAAVEVLEEAGYQVLVPQRNLCCGRPLYDYGMLELAGYKLRRILDALRPQISAGVPMVGLEPSCVSVFRDEMKALLPHDADAQRLSGKTFTLAEFLIKEAQFEPPSMTGQAIVHGHCHDKSILDFQAEEQLLKRMGLSVNTPDSGCCGMAGSFGFERGDKYDLSIKCGERVLLPAVRQASPKTLLVADGFSCRTQIQQGAGRRAMHLAQVVRLGMDEERKMAFGRSRVTVPRTFGLEATLPPVDGTGSGVVAPRPRWRKRAPLLMGVAAGSLALAYLASRYGLPALKTRLPLARRALLSGLNSPLPLQR